MSGRKSILRNTITGSVTRIVGLALGFVTTPVLITTLGDKGFGLFTLVAALTAYAGLLDFGIGAGLVRHYTEFSERGDKGAIRQVTTLALGFYGLLFVLLLFPLAWVAPSLSAAIGIGPDLQAEAVSAILLMFGFFIASCVSGVFAARLTSLHRLDIVSLVSLAGQFLYAVLVFTVLPRSPTVTNAVVLTLVQVLAPALVMGALVVAWDKSILCSPLAIPRWLVRKTLSYGGWMQLNSVAAIVSLELDKVLIGRFVGIASVTPYQIANRLASLNRLLPFQFLAAVFPSATVVSVRGDRAALESFYIRMSRYLMVLTMPITGFVMADADRFIMAWIGRPYPEAVLIAAALALSYALNNLTGGGTTIARAAEVPRYETYYAVVSTVLNIALTIALAPTFGLAGIIGGTIIANIVGSLFFLLLIRRVFGFGLWRTLGSWFLPLCAATLLGSVVILAVHWVVPPLSVDGRFMQFVWLGAEGVLFTLAFAGGLLLFRFWTDDELEAFWRVMPVPRPPFLSH